MNKEIKEAIMYLEHTGKDDFNLLEHQKENRIWAIKVLLDCITNLKKTNKNHSEKLIELGDKITNLHEENIKLTKALEKKDKEIEKLNNTINELKQKLNLAENILYDYLYKDKKITKKLYDSFKELKGDSSNE